MLRGELNSNYPQIVDHNSHQTNNEVDNEIEPQGLLKIKLHKKACQNSLVHCYSFRQK